MNSENVGLVESRSVWVVYGVLRPVCVVCSVLEEVGVCSVLDGWQNIPKVPLKCQVQLGQQM